MTYKSNLIFLANNDGSDMRINKELKTLSSHYNIYFIGVGKYSDLNFAREFCTKFFLINKKRNSPKAIFLHILKFLKWYRRYNIKSCHVINEQFLLFFLPIHF